MTPLTAVEWPDLGIAVCPRPVTTPLAGMMRWRTRERIGGERMTTSIQG